MHDAVEAHQNDKFQGFVKGNAAVRNPAGKHTAASARQDASGSDSTGLFTEAFSSPKKEENILNLTGFYEKGHEHPSNELRKLVKGSIQV